MSAEQNDNSEAVEETAVEPGFPPSENSTVEGSVEAKDTPHQPPASTDPTEQAAGEGEVGTEGEPKPEPKPDPKPQSDWRDRRIAQLTARLKEFQEKQQTAEDRQPDPVEDFNKRVAEAAERQVAAREFQDRCNAVVNKGREQFGATEFDTRLAQLRNVVDQTDPAAVAAYENFVRAGLETGNLEKIIYDLAADPNETVRVLSMPPMKMAVELARRSVTDDPERVSQTPKPIKPVNGGGARSHTAIDPTDPGAADRLETAEWMRRREAQLANGSRR